MRWLGTFRWSEEIAPPPPPFYWPKCDYEWQVIEESLPYAQWQYGKDPKHGWPYPVH